MIEKLKKYLETAEGKVFGKAYVDRDDLREIIRQLEQAEKMREALGRIIKKDSGYDFIDAWSGPCAKIARAALSQAKGDA